MLPRRWSRQFTGPALALVVVGLLRPEAAADPLGDAKVAYQRGAAHYEKGDYAEAVRDFDLAYRLSKRPAILYNLARAEGQLGHDEAAIAWLRRYLEEAPRSPDAPSVRAEMAARQRALDEAAATRRAQADAVVARKQAVVAEARALALSDAVASSGAMRGPRIAGWVLLGGGVVLAGGGVLAGLIARDAARQVGAGGGSGASKLDQSLERRGQTSEIAGFVCDGLGAALMAAGVGVVVWSHRGPAARPQAPVSGSAWITPAPGGLLVAGTY